MHEANGFYKMGVRYYDPKVGRFISEDPIDFAGGDTNLSRYVKNNPLSFIDPYGLYCTSDFVRHYYRGGGATVDLGTVGLLYNFQKSASVTSAVDAFKNKVRSSCQSTAKNLCCDKDTGIKTTTLKIKDNTITDVTNEPCLFAVGHSTFLRAASCNVSANCKSKLFTFNCSLNFWIRDWFKDPIGIGVEPGGTPYRINADWIDNLSGSGRF